MKFSEIEIREQRYEKHLGEPGLYARVNPSGSISIYYKYSGDGMSSKLPLGKYPDLSQAEILKEYRKARGDVAKGLDPLYEKEQRKIEIRQERLARKNEVSVETAAAQWLIDRRHSIADRTLSGYRSSMKCHVSQSAIWKMPIKDVTYHDLVKIIEKIHDSKTPAAAGNVKRAISNLFNWSVKAGYLQYSVAAHLSPTSSDDPEHNEVPDRDRVLTDGEIRDLWHEMVDEPFGAPAKLVLLTGCRRPEIIGMHSSEIDGDWWTVPKKRIKTRRKKKQDFRVYLGPLARSLLTREEGFMFPSTRISGVHMDEKRMTDEFGRARAALGIPGGDEPDGIWLYDCRRTLRTRIEEQFAETMPYVGGLLLNHNRGKIDGIYNRYAYDSQKKKAMLWWDAELTRILGLGKVFKIAV